MGGIEKEESQAWLENGVKYVRIIWCDTSGQRRCRLVPASKFKSGSISTLGVALAKVVMGMSSSVDGPSPGCGLTGTGEIRFVPDLSSGHAVLQQPGHALVMGDMMETPGVPWEFCPRGTLRRLAKMLNAEFGLEMRAGFELEFYMLKQLEGAGKYKVVDTANYCSCPGLNNSLPVVDSILSWLESLGVSVDQFHCEAGQGQFECALTYDDVSKSADKLVFAREGITAAAMSHQLVATFLPKPPVAGTTLGSGNHCHFSIWKDGVNATGAGTLTDANRGISDLGESFVAGILHHLPSVMAIVASHPNSYDRILPNTWSGAFQCWGTQNREAPLRAVPEVTSGAINNFELKSFDGCSNPHLGLATILAAGLDGLRNKMKLPEPVDENPAELAEGKVARVPASLKEAVESLKKNEALKDLLGKNLTNCILAVREAEIGFFSKNPIECKFPLDTHVIPLLHTY